MTTDLQSNSESLDPQACWGVLERVAASPPLKRAARLREFLLYVGNKSLREGRADIHEQEIGEAVFGRPHDYETRQDNIVRVSATELRKRVDAYFTTEGRAEPIVFEIPRGSYLPVFRLRESALQAPPAGVGEPATDIEPAPSEGTHASQRGVLFWAVAAIAVLLAVACILLWRQNAELHRRIHLLENQQSVIGERPARSYLSVASKPVDFP